MQNNQQNNIRNKLVDNERRLALVVDDDEVNRIILQGMLQKQGYDVVTAENGKQAVEKFIEHNPTIVLMDIVMPVMDGYEATSQIKQLAGDRFVPVIFLTAIVDENELARCVKVGGDDFLSKPFSQVILMAKIEALSRMEKLYSMIKFQRDEIDKHNEQMMLEQKVAKRIFSKVIHEGFLDLPNVRYILSPLSIFNGDLLLAARTPSGGLNILMGDATGHGLPAAIGAVPVSDIFYELTDNGATVDEIVQEINAKLKHILPTEFFFCASILNISNDFNLLTIWHAGLPDVLIYSEQEKRIKHKIASMSVPLGVTENTRLDTRPVIIQLSPADRIYLYSDGITEATNQQNEEYGEQRLLELFAEGSDAETLFDRIVQSVYRFRGSQEQSDDITLLELTVDGPLPETHSAQLPQNAIHTQPGNWHITMRLGPEDFRITNPVSILTRFATSSGELLKHRENIFIILSELYNNALDHGVLGLDSSLKAQPDGFARYLLLRQERLDDLQQGMITINVEHRLIDRMSGELTVLIKDSGSGFEPGEHIKNTENSLVNSHGWGLPLVRSICKELQFLDHGNVIRAIYRWQNAPE